MLIENKSFFLQIYKSSVHNNKILAELNILYSIIYLAIHIIISIAMIKIDIYNKKKLYYILLLNLLIYIIRVSIIGITLSFLLIKIDLLMLTHTSPNIITLIIFSVIIYIQKPTRTRIDELNELSQKEKELQTQLPINNRKDLNNESKKSSIITEKQNHINDILVSTINTENNKEEHGI